MNNNKKWRILIIAAVATFCSGQVLAHGFVGQRFFPATITIDDPLPGDEFDLSTFVTESPVDVNEEGEGGNAWTTNPVATWSKRITPFLQFSIAESYLHIHNPGDEPNQNGFEDTNIGVLYEAYQNPVHESVVSLGFNLTLGNTGSKSVDADTFTTYAPAILFGQGFGALPDSMKYLRPFALTGSISPNFTSDNSGVQTVEYGLALMYNLPYMQAFVHSTSMPSLMNHIIPVVEFPFERCTAGDCSGQTSGTINPGFLAVWKYGQIGLEAVIPVNKTTGNRVGVVLQAHFYFDDIFPNSFLGKPLFS